MSAPQTKAGLGLLRLVVAIEAESFAAGQAAALGEANGAPGERLTSLGLDATMTLDEAFLLGYKNGEADERSRRAAAEPKA